MRGAIAKKSTVEGEWRPVFKDRDGAWAILLNKDPESRARTLAVKYTKGFEVLESLHDGTVEVLVLEGQEGKLFRPLAYTKNFAMLVAAVLALTLEGQWQVGPMVYGPGDYFCVPGGVKHGPERALSDVRILVVSHGPLTPGP